MKNYKFKIKKGGPPSAKTVLASLLFLFHFTFLIFNCASQTSVLFPLAQMTGTTNDTTVTIRPINNPVNFHSQIFWLPPAGIQLRTTNGSATTNLIPNDYTVTIAGVPGAWRISVNDTNITLNAAEIGNLTTYTFTNHSPGVLQLVAGSNITLSPPIGKGVVTITAAGGGGGGSATNAYQTKAGNNLITIVTNQTDFIYTISGVSQTNGYPWGVLYDAAGTVQAATNGISIASGLAAFRGTNTFAPTNVATASKVGLVKPDGSTITVGSDGTISATTGGAGTVTNVGLSMPGEFSVANSPVTSGGTLAVTRTADANFLGFGATNVGFIKVTNSASIGGQATISTLILTNGFTNQSLTASTLVEADPNKKMTSIPNAFGAITNDGAGNFGYVPLLDASTLAASRHVATGASTNLISSEDATGYTNTIAWTHEGATTNITATFNGTLQSATITNGPDIYFSYAGKNGSCSYRITTNSNLHFNYQPKWLAGSNSVITNGILSLTSYGGTNATQIEAAMKENQ